MEKVSRYRHAADNNPGHISCHLLWLRHNRIKIAGLDSPQINDRALRSCECVLDSTNMSGNIANIELAISTKVPHDQSALAHLLWRDGALSVSLQMRWCWLICSPYILGFTNLCFAIKRWNSSLLFLRDYGLQKSITIFSYLHLALAQLFCLDSTLRHDKEQRTSTYFKALVFSALWLVLSIHSTWYG